ncbi:MAG: 3-deoxy-7-phosphoheptulonate synthase [Planctomycetota bacterium]
MSIYRDSMRAPAQGAVTISKGLTLGSHHDLVIMAGPCAVESREQVESVACFLEELAVPIMRGGAFKPRTSPYEFQGMGEPGLKMLKEAVDAHGLKMVTEVMDTSQLEPAMRYADIIQVGARSMNNTCLLRALGETELPVLLKRGFSNSIEELLLAAEHIQNAGNTRILLCERGIRTFENATRFTLDISAVAVLKHRTGFPVVVDPSHAAGDRMLVPALAQAAVAAGADALLLEVHPDPDHALCDARQSLRFDQFAALLPRLRQIRQTIQSGVRPSAQALPFKTKTAQNPME